MHEWKATGCVEEDSRKGLYWVMWVCSKCDKRMAGCHIAAQFTVPGPCCKEE